MRILSSVVSWTLRICPAAKWECKKERHDGKFTFYLLSRFSITVHGYTSVLLCYSGSYMPSGPVPLRWGEVYLYLLGVWLHPRLPRWDRWTSYLWWVLCIFRQMQFTFNIFSVFISWHDSDRRLLTLQLHYFIFLVLFLLVYLVKPQFSFKVFACTSQPKLCKKYIINIALYWSWHHPIITVIVSIGLNPAINLSGYMTHSF